LLYAFEEFFITKRTEFAKTALIALGVLLCPTVQAIDEVSLSVGSITAKAWHLQGVSIALSALNETPQQLVLTVDKLQLPVPQTELSVLDIRCTAFTLQTGELRCQHGQASLHSPQWQTRTAQFLLAPKEAKILSHFHELPSYSRCHHSAA
jgi:hypothetical protein